MDSYNRKTDEELLRRMHNGDKKVIDYLMVKYKNLVRKKAKALFLIGADNDDLIQEGMIGLFKAIRDYQEEKDSSFYHFAEICKKKKIKIKKYYYKYPLQKNKYLIKTPCKEELLLLNNLLRQEYISKLKRMLS